MMMVLSIDMYHVLAQPILGSSIATPSSPSRRSYEASGSSDAG